MSFLSNIVKKVKSNFSDDKGFFRGNKFTTKPLQRQLPQVNQPTPTYTPQTPVTQFPTLEPPKPSFKTNSAEKLNSRLEMIKNFGTSKPEVVEPKKNIWDTGFGKGLVKAQEFTKPMADNMFNSVETYKNDPTKIVTEGVPKFLKGALIDNPKMAARWAWNTGSELAGKSRQDLEQQKQDEAIKQKLLWNKLNTAKKYRDMGDVESAARLEEEVKQGINEPNRFDKFEQDIEQKKNQLKADAVGTSMLLASAGQPINPKQLATAGGISAGMGLVAGQDPFEAAGQGIANAQRFKAVTQFTDPAITKTINTFVNEKTAPVISKVTTKLISGTGNVIEDRLIDKLEGKQRGIMDDLSSFVMGAIMGNTDPKAGKFEKGDFKPSKLITDIKTKIKVDWIASGKLDPKDSEALDKVVDKIIMLGVKEDGDLTNMKGSTNLFTDEPDILDEELSNLKDKKGIFAFAKKHGINLPTFDEFKKQEDIDFEKFKNGTEYDTPEPEPKTELDWLKENNKKTNSIKPINDILGGRDYSKPQPIMVKGVDISNDVNKMMSEGWKPDEINYAIKLANESKVSAPNKDWGAYVRGILKKGQPVKASGMGGKGVVKQEAPDTTKSDFNAKQIENEVKTSPKQQTIKIADLPDRATAIGMDKEAFDTMAADIKTNGIKNPIIIDKKTGQVLDGMHRAFVAQQIGMEEIPVKYVDGSKMSLDDARKAGGSYEEHQKRLNEKYLEEHPVKNEAKTTKVTTQEPKVDSRASSEVTEPKKTTEIEDMVALEKERGKKRISEMFTKTDFENTKNKYTNVEVEDLPKKIDITTDKGVDLVAKIKQAKKLDDLGYNSDNAWKEIQKIESEIKTPVVETPKIKKINNLLGSEKQVKPSVEPKVEQSTTPVKKVETTPITEPKVEKVETPVKPLAPETKHYSPEEVKKATDFESRVVKVGDMATKEGVSLSKKNIQDVLSGKKEVSPELKTEIEKIQSELREKEISVGTAVRDESEYHISDVDLTKTNTELTSQDNFADTVIGSTFDAAKKNTGAVANKNKADWVDASIAEHRSIMRKQNQADILTGKIMEENDVPKEKATEVKKIVEEEIEIRKEISTKANKNIKAGKLPKTDIVGTEAARENRINDLIGNGKKRPIIKAKNTSVKVAGKSIDDQFRTEATFFRDKTNDEIYNALIDLRKAEKGTGDMDYGTAKRRFYNIVTKYDYEDSSVKDGVNYYLNRRIATNKVIEGNVKKAIRGVTRQLSRSQIGLNAKVTLEQPFEVLRLAADDTYGLKKTKDAIKSAVPYTEEYNRIVKEYGLQQEKSGNVPIKDVLAKTDDNTKGIRKLFRKGVELTDNILYKGVAATENWKNVVFAKAAETEGISRGLKGQDLKSFVEKELIRIAHISDSGMTPKLMNNAVGAGGFQYQQYSMKQNMLLWDTLTGETPKTKKAKQIAKYLIADYTAKGILAGITGTAAISAGDWALKMVEPKLGPLLTIPYTMAKNQYNYMMMDEDEKEKVENPLTSSTAETIKTALTPGGVQIRAKTMKVADIMKEGQALSKKGNVNYVSGEMNPLQKGQALLFGVGAIPNKKEADKRWARLDKDGIYPTLTAEQSKVLMSKKTDAEKEAYYNQQMKLQTPNKDVVKARKGEKQNLIQKIFNKNEVDPNASLVPAEGSTPQDRTKFKSQIKAFIDSGDTSSVEDEEWNSYFFDEVNKMPESDSIEKHQKEIDRWKKITTIENNEDLDQETKDKIIANSGVNSNDLEYYKNASLDNGSKKVLLTKLANQEDRNAVIQSLIEAKRVVGNKALATNTETDYLYDMGLISKDEKKLIDSWKYDEIQGDFYQDRDYKASGSGEATAKAKKLETARKALFDDLEKLNKPSKKSKLIETILQMNQKKVTEPKTVGSLLESTKFAKKKITQNNTNTGNIKSVKRIYRFKK